MYITRIKNNNKNPKTNTCTLLRESYREKKVVKTRTIANLSHLSEIEIQALEYALKNKEDIFKILNKKSVDKIYKSIGAVYLINQILKKLGIMNALGKDLNGKLAMLQIISRVINQGSCLSTIRNTSQQSLCEVLKIKEKINEDSLYENLSWLSQEQSEIELKIFKNRYKESAPTLYLYDVTSSYFEGTMNAMGMFGYNRDKKQGKMQVVAGLLCDDNGYPLSIELFNGNTLDYKTMETQILKVAERFKCKNVVFVGDRGMIKEKQIASITEQDFYYITAITKPQVQKLLKDEVFEMSLFDTELKEVEYNRIRYILKRNPKRAMEMRRSRQQKEEALTKFVKGRNEYLSQHQRAKVLTAINKTEEKLKKLKLENYLTICKTSEDSRELEIVINESALAELTLLDGCYVIKTNLPLDVPKEKVHEHYKDLSKVERAFRNMKTDMLELRPWYVRKEESTRGHAFVVMLAYSVVKYLEVAWKDIGMPIKEGISALNNISLIEQTFKNGDKEYVIPEPNKEMQKLLELAGVELPNKYQVIPINVVSNKIK